MYHKWQWFDIWFLRYQLQHTDFFSHLWPFFALSPANSPKNENIKKMKKKHQGISSFYRSVPKIVIISYTIPEILHDAMEHDGCNYYFSFWAIFCPFTSLTAGKMKIFKKSRSTSRYHHFTLVYQKSYLYPILFLRYGTWWM